MIQSVNRTMRILSVLSDSKGKPVKLSDVAEKTALHKATCSHILETLIEIGYVEKVSRSRGYVLGPSTYLLTRYGKYDDDLVSVCRPIMRYLFKKTGEVVILSVMRGNTKYLIDHIDKDLNIFLDHFNISKDDIYRTASGRILLASLSEEEIKKTFNKYGPPKNDEWNGIETFEQMRHALLRLSADTIVRTDNPHPEAGVVLIELAAPIKRNKVCIASLALSIRCKYEDYEAFSKREVALKSILTKAVTEIGRRLYYEEA